MGTSNFAVVMDLLGITPQALSVAIGVDVTLISRWRTGGRNLVYGRQWATRIAEFFLERDAAQKPPVLGRLLAPFYPIDDADDPKEQRKLLERFLTQKDQFSDAYQLKRKKLLLDVFSQKPTREGQRRTRRDKGIREVAAGTKSINSAMLDFLDKALESGRPMSILFVCPGDLALVTENEEFGEALMDRLMRLFAQGSRMKAVLRTDFRMSDVSYFSGRWLVAHLLDYIKSYYYDDYRKLDDLRMMGIFGDKMAFRILPDSKQGYRGEFYYNASEINGFEREFMKYYDASAQRFHYSFFSHPDDFLLNLPSKVSGSCFQFTRLPHFGVRAEMPAALKVTETESHLLRHQFAPFFHAPDTLSPTVRIHHVFCSDEIESALDKPRHLVAELSVALNRRIYMPTQLLVDQLAAIRRLIDSRDNYSVCFLPKQAFDQLGMQIVVWGGEAAIGWIPGSRCTACRDYTNVGALHGFCATMWARIPGTMKTKGVVNGKLNTWLRRAKKYGYAVE